MQQIGLDFEVQVSEVEENVTSTVPAEVVQELSRQKAEAVAKLVFVQTNDRAWNQDIRQKINTDDSMMRSLVLGADTIVACDGRILGKPKDAADAVQMLTMLSGRAHEVYTGVTFVYTDPMDGAIRTHTFYECTKVHFASMTAEEIAEYVATGDPMDKAGAYGIQGFCARYITGIEGDYNNVVGLPVGRVYQELRKIIHKLGIDAF